MSDQTYYIYTGVALLLVAVFVYLYKHPTLKGFGREGFKTSGLMREHFKVLGTLGKQAPAYYQCLSECERSDPGKQLSPTHGNMMCQEYCDETLTRDARRGGPTYYKEKPLPPVKFSTPLERTFERCGYGTKGEWCRQLYGTDGEIDEKCRQQCEYNTDPTNVCMKQCTASYSGNRYIGWNWK